MNIKQEQKKVGDIKTQSPSATPVNPSTSKQETGFFAKIGDRFNAALQSSRGGGNTPATPPPLIQRVTEESPLSRLRPSKSQKMYIPEGVVIQGSMVGNSDTEIYGTVEGDVSLEATLLLGKNAMVTGNIKALSAQIEGEVKGRVSCSEEITLAATGRLASDASAGKYIRIAGKVEGNVKTPGTLRIESGGVVNGDVQARVFSMDEGAELNGRCTMRTSEESDPAEASVKNNKGK